MPVSRSLQKIMSKNWLSEMSYAYTSLNQFGNRYFKSRFAESSLYSAPYTVHAAINIYLTLDTFTGDIRSAASPSPNLPPFPAPQAHSVLLSRSASV